MVRLAQKAFYPGKLPFPLLHIDTTWKFREMIAFRDRFCRENGFELLVHTNREPEAEGMNPFDHGSQKYTTIMKTHALVQALAQVRLRRGLRRRPPRRGEEPRQGAGLLVPRQVQPVGPEEPAPRAVEPLQRPHQQGREHPRLPPLQLDRARRLAVHPPGEHPHRPALLRRRAPGGGARRRADHGRRRAHAPPARRGPAAEAGALPHAGLLPAHGRHRVHARRPCRRSSARCCSRGTPSGRAG